MLYSLVTLQPVSICMYLHWSLLLHLCKWTNIIKNIIQTILLFSFYLLLPSAAGLIALAIKSNVHFVAYCCENRESVEDTPKCLTCVLELRLQSLEEYTRKRDLWNVRGIIRWRCIVKFLLFRCIKALGDFLWYLTEWLLYCIFCEMPNPILHGYAQNLQIFLGVRHFLVWEISVNSAVQALTGRITQDCTGEGLFITTHQTFLSA